MLKSRMLPLGLLAASLAPVALIGQTGSTTVTPSLTAFDVERRFALSDLQTNQTFTFPAAVQSRFQSGALQGRERLIFNANNNTITSTMFLREPSAAFPTPLSNLGADLSQVYQLLIDRTYFSTKPRPNMLAVGTVSGTSMAGPFGDLSGAPASVAVTFSDDFKTITNVVTTVGGVVSTFSASGAGTIAVKDLFTSTPGGGGPGATGPTANAGPERVTATTLQWQLDGSTSEAGPNGPVTYSWRLLQGKTAAILNGNTARPTIQFGEGFGDYVFELTVTDSKGMTSTDRIIVSYNGDI
jgi:hypothetical protein